jgi:hypothetical protein
VRTFEVTRVPEHEGCDSLHGTATTAPDEFLILVDGQRIGGTYLGSRPLGDGTYGDQWISYGPAGFSCGHASREAAEQAQVRAYATDPSGYDRHFTMARARRKTETARQEAERQAGHRAREAGRRRELLGDDGPGTAIWVLPAFHALYAGGAEVQAVAAWLGANDVTDVCADHEVRVEQRATRRVAVYQTPSLVLNGRASASTEPRAVTIMTSPPPITTPDRPDLHPLFAEHYPTRFPLIDGGFGSACGQCTSNAKATTAEQMVSWPCPVAAGPATSAGQPSPRCWGSLTTGSRMRWTATLMASPARTRRQKAQAARSSRSGCPGQLSGGRGGQHSPAGPGDHARTTHRPLRCPDFPDDDLDGVRAAGRKPA